MSDLDWFAGVFEGEGCISIHKAGRRGYTMLTVCVMMTNREIIERFCARFGTKMQAPIRKAAPHHKQRYEWRVRGQTAADVLRVLAPHFRSARLAAKVALALEFADQQQQGSREPGYKDGCAAFRERMQALNRRGDPLPVST